MAEQAVQRMSVDEFLAWEARQEQKYELENGRPVMMTGGTRAHNAVQLAIGSEFRRQLRGGPCRAYIDLKVVCETGNVRYPDAQIDCGAGAPTDLQATKPVVVAEVVSPSSQVTDYISKLKDYSSVASITTYLIFRPDEAQVSVLRRVGRHLELESVVEGLDALLTLPEVGIELRLGDIYDETVFSEG